LDCHSPAEIQVAIKPDISRAEPQEAGIPPLLLAKAVVAIAAAQ
jgi:hypothetical protein